MIRDKKELNIIKRELKLPSSLLLEPRLLNMFSDEQASITEEMHFCSSGILSQMIICGIKYQNVLK